MAMFRDNRLSRLMTGLFASVTPDTPTRSATSPFEIEQMLRGDEYSVTPDGAMRVSAVFACIRILSQSQAMLPLLLMRKDDNTGRRTIDDMHPVHRVMQRPNQWQTQFEFESMMTAHKHLRGNAFAYVARVGGRDVQELIPLRPDCMEVVPPSAGAGLQYKYKLPGKAVRVFAREEIHHRRGLTTDGYVGLSPIGAAREAIRLAMRTEQHGSKLFTNAAKPSGVLKSPKALSGEAAKRLKESFDDTYAGNDNAHKTIVLEDGLEWQQVGMSAEDSQFIESRKFQRNEIAMFFGVPPHMIGDIDRGTSWGSGIEQQSLGFLVHTLNPHLISDQQSLARDLLTDKDRRTRYVTHDAGILTRAQFLTRQQGLEIQLRNGVINPNEWRQIEGLNPREDDEGDDYVRPGSSAATEAPADPGSDGTEDDGTEDDGAEARPN